MLTRWQRARDTATGPRVIDLAEAPLLFEPGDVCISLLAADLPASVKDAVHRSQTPWMHYEYLTAEPWAAGCHALPSPAPSGGPTKWYFFPGFTADSGGLLREQDLRQRRQAFGPLEQQQWLAANKLQCAVPDPLRVCLFGYPDQPLRTLVDALRTVDRPVQLILHEKLFNDLGTPPGSNQFTVTSHPWFDQEAFDHLLWSCDLNVVRGEESWVRAHWAQTPFVWQPYRQADDAHIPKLAAFLADLLPPGKPTPAHEAVHGLANALSPVGNQADPDTMQRALSAYLAEMPAICTLHRARSEMLYAQSSAVTRLQTFIADQLQ
jgi:uncharacterized repeat protein (TIGR03837 family)